ncbi:hypothetical protein THAOC_35416 [Thalassiosira oceanica]|uniref:Uncharacterized protein n=1 Tax=Thalassiosira oceanica TaxID=159749 RepID=K0RA96_THAOC|nr:hypothetical protein THAOC_35416 [Thalassiosira oceanica]|eukprot:EJK45946.1 hypothetical protein THAOC_35416 [Thalassiosira oceanica]
MSGLSDADGKNGLALAFKGRLAATRRLLRLRRCDLLAGTRGTKSGQTSSRYLASSVFESGLSQPYPEKLGPRNGAGFLCVAFDTVGRTSSDAGGDVPSPGAGVTASLEPSSNSFVLGAFLGSPRRGPRDPVLLGAVLIKLLMSGLAVVLGHFEVTMGPLPLAGAPVQLPALVVPPRLLPPRGSAAGSRLAVVLGHLKVAMGPLPLAGAPVQLPALVVLPRRLPPRGSAAGSGLAVVLGHLKVTMGPLPLAGAPVQLSALVVLPRLLPPRGSAAGLAIFSPNCQSASSAHSSPSSIGDSTDVRSMMGGVKHHAPADSDDGGSNFGASGRREELSRWRGDEAATPSDVGGGPPRDLMACALSSLWTWGDPRRIDGDPPVVDEALDLPTSCLDIAPLPDRKQLQQDLLPILGLGRRLRPYITPEVPQQEMGLAVSGVRLVPLRPSPEEECRPDGPRPERVDVPGVMAVVGPRRLGDRVGCHEPRSLELGHFIQLRPVPRIQFPTEVWPRVRAPPPPVADLVAARGPLHVCGV